MPLQDHFPNITLTHDQKEALVRLERFLMSDDNIFILKGYAGTGKTTLIKGLVDYIVKEKKFSHLSTQKDTTPPSGIYQLMAPTGRAAKVLSNKTGYYATTIHKGIYDFSKLLTTEETDEKGETTYRFYFDIAINNYPYKILIVDEASMISDVHLEDVFFKFGSGHLLKDLIRYSGVHIPGNITKIIFVGDPAQLPPIGMNFSPALDSQYLKQNYNLVTREYEMKEVVRQKSESGVLRSATYLRNNLIPRGYKRMDVRENGKDIFHTTPEILYSQYEPIKIKHKIIVTFKNKTAYHYNQLIRNKIFGHEEDEELPMQKGDIIIVGVNNYIHNVMNGEFGVVMDVDPLTITRGIPLRTKKGKGVYITLTWRRVKLLFSDNRQVDGYILENFLKGNESKLTDEERLALFVDFKNRMKELYPNIKVKSEEFKEKLKTDPFFNALQIKYGYAVTCHKAQGGEWKNVFVIFDDYMQEKKNDAFYKWAYTAITRSNQNLYAINPPYFHSFSDIIWIPVKLQNTINELFGEEKTKFIVRSAKHDEILKHFGLDDKPLTVQNHFIKLYEGLKPHGIEIAGRERVEYEIRYIFRRGDKQVVLKFWINKKNLIKDKFEDIPSMTNSIQLKDEIIKLLPEILKTKIEMQPDDKPVATTGQNLFSPKWDEFPVLKRFYEEWKRFIPEDIGISRIDHYDYMERYTFIRGEEKAVINFTYDSKGFFSKAWAIHEQCNSQKLLDSLEQIIERLKQ